jgi:hypothetical protein
MLNSATVFFLESPDLLRFAPVMRLPIKWSFVNLNLEGRDAAAESAALPVELLLLLLFYCCSSASRLLPAAATGGRCGAPPAPSTPLIQRPR